MKHGYVSAFILRKYRPRRGGIIIRLPKERRFAAEACVDLGISRLVGRYEDGTSWHYIFADTNLVAWANAHRCELGYLAGLVDWDSSLNLNAKGFPSIKMKHDLDFVERQTGVKSGPAQLNVNGIMAKQLLLKADNDGPLVVRQGMLERVRAWTPRSVHNHDPKIKYFEHKVDFNVRAFATLTNESLYWLGYLMADGCISSRGTVILGSKDVDIIEKFCSFLKLPQTYIKTIRTKTNYGTYVGASISASNPDLLSDLAHYGIVQRKTFHEVATPELATSRDFWRGMIDGDGCVGLFKNRNSAVGKVSLGSSIQVCEAFANYCHDLGLHTSIRPMRSIYEVSVSGYASADLVKILYQDGDTAMARKANKASGITRYYAGKVLHQRHQELS